MTKDVQAEAIRPRAYIYGLIAVVLFSLVVSFFCAFSPQWQWQFIMNGYGRVEETYDLLTVLYFAPLMCCLFIAVLNRTGKVFLNKNELLIVISMLWVVVWIPNWFGTLNFWANGYNAIQNSYWFDYYVRFAKPVWNLFGPAPWTDMTKWNSFFYGGSVNWADWGLPTMFAIAWYTPYFLMGVFFAAIMRRQWVEVENLPFPMVTGITRMLNMTYTKEEGKKRPAILTNKYLWIGIILSIVSCAPSWITNVVPSLQSTRPWIVPGNPGEAKVAITWGWDFIPLNLLPWVPIVVNLDLPAIGAMLFVPSATLLSYIVFEFILFWILPPVWVAAGWWDPGVPGNTVSIIYNYIAEGFGPVSNANWRAVWGGIYAWFGQGALFGVILIPLIMYRKEVFRQVKSIFKSDEEMEKDEPMKYRYLWAGFIICMLLTAIAWWYGSAGSAPFIWILISMAGIFIFWQVQTSRVTAEFGAVGAIQPDNPAHYLQSSLSYWWIAPGGPMQLDQGARFLAIRGSLQYGFTNRGVPLKESLEMYSVGQKTQIHPKHIFIAGFLAVIVSILVTEPTFITVICHFGEKNLESIMVSATETGEMRYPFYICQDVPTMKSGIPPVPTQWVAFAIGIAQTVVLTILRARLPWFPLSPAGAAIAWFFQPWAMLWPAIIAYILRLIVIRVGGIKMYEDKLMPLAIGLVAGWTIMSVLSCVAVSLTYISAHP
jgi:hypothetical protein